MDHDAKTSTSKQPISDAVNSAEETSPTPIEQQTYIGQWHGLISTTNWHKGQIIHEWRVSLMDSGAETSEFSDETWSQLVGGVSGQHVGRLRRVFERFGDVYSQYDGLFWSHFQAALDWDEAEMWLEGAVQNGWSVAGMRRQRWETLGSVAADEPRDGDLIAVETDEDFADGTTADANQSTSPSGDLVVEDFPTEARSPAGPDFGDEDEIPSRPSDAPSPPENTAANREKLGDPVRPFENLADLPDDVAEAFESFQLAILRHKAEEWQEVSLEDVLASLDALKSLALAPVE